jgi:hypothetical protein
MDIDMRDEHGQIHTSWIWRCSRDTKFSICSVSRNGTSEISYTLPFSEASDTKQNFACCSVSRNDTKRNLACFSTKHAICRKINCATNKILWEKMETLIKCPGDRAGYVSRYRILQKLCVAGSNAGQLFASLDGVHAVRLQGTM